LDSAPLLSSYVAIAPEFERIWGSGLLQFPRDVVSLVLRDPAKSLSEFRKKSGDRIHFFDRFLSFFLTIPVFMPRVDAILSRYL